MIGGFVRIAGMFENLSIEPSVWATAGYVTPISLKECIEEDISQIQELEDIGQIQKLELLISGRWLQAKMWKFSAKRQTAFYVSNDPWQLRQPVVIGRAVLDVLESFSTVLMESHSIALVGSNLESPSSHQFFHVMNERTDNELRIENCMISENAYAM